MAGRGAVSRQLVRLACIAAITVAASWLIWCTVDEARSNFHQVVRGKLYRCGQLSPSVLDGRLRIHRIRSIVNLRGPNPKQSWYESEHAAAARADVLVYDIALCSDAAPTSGDLKELVRVFSQCPRPVLIHCESGLDRSGLAATIFLLSQEKCSIEHAEQQMGIRYGIPPGRERTERHRAFVHLYEAWLSKVGKTHSRENFRQWAMEVYHRPEHLGGPDWNVCYSKLPDQNKRKNP